MLQVASRQRNWIGAATEHLTIGRLLEQGHRVAIPVVDEDGADLVVNYSLRVQVKSSQLHEIERNPYWVFKSPSGWRADIYVFRGTGAILDRWWVVPHSVLELAGISQSISISPIRGRGKWGSALEQFENAWHVFG